MSTPEVKLVPALPEHLDVWIAMRNGPTSRRLLPLDDDSRESLLKRLSEASSDVADPRARSFRWMVGADGQIAGTVSARELSRFHGRIEIGYMPEANLASQGLARKLGFVQEGLLRGHCLVQGKRTDKQIWGLLRSEWEVRRGTLTVK